MNRTIEASDYINWQSTIDLDSVFSKPTTPNYLQARDGYLYWVESLTEEKGRTVICCADDKGNVSRLTPNGFNVRTKANEYGGRAYVVGESALYFCNYADQRIYRQSLSQPDDIRPLSSTKDVYFADLSLSSDEAFLFCVMESKREPENICSIAYFETANVDLGGEPNVLIEGADFYASLTIDAKSNRVKNAEEINIAWIEWNHPNMPWDATSCKSAKLLNESGKGLSIASVEEVNTHLNAQANALDDCLHDGQATAAHSQFAMDGSIFLTVDYPGFNSIDEENFAHIYQWKDKQLKRLTHGSFEYSYPHWIFGNERFCQIDEHRLLAVCTDKKGDQLHLIDTNSAEVTRLAEDYSVFNHLVSSGDGGAFVMASKSTDATHTLRFCPEKLEFTVFDLIKEVGEESEQEINMGSQQSYPIDQTSLPELLEVNVGDNKCAYAYYYPPKNTSIINDDVIGSSPPPLLVMVHGGPTARAYPNFDIQKQFWTSSGFAVLDVNHRGSSGFGRAYRDELLGEWGEVDAKDIYLSVQKAVEAGLANKDRLFIRGKSAGGYAVQRALTLYPDLFTAGASYYGIGDLVTLSEITHKFESHYTDRLIGEEFALETAQLESSLYHQRSPINAIDNLESPMIVFQGGEDKVVPPQLAMQIVDALVEKGVVCDYHLYEHEGHGFRSKSVLVDCLTKELAFYRRFFTP